MVAARASEWRKLPLSLTELCTDTTLRCGQSFRWQKINDEWHCTLHGRLVSLKQDPTHLHYRVTWPKTAMSPLTPPSTTTLLNGKAVSVESPSSDDTEALLKNYFNLEHDLTLLYEQWAGADPNFRKRAPKFAGVRILNQDAWEALICFICSSNNNISRISQMVRKLCLHYGPFIGKIGDEVFHDFPTPESLTDSRVESHLRELGFGYRAKYIAETARIVSEDKPKDWLLSLRNPGSPAWGDSRSGERSPAAYKEAHEQLVELSGVGPKVADCVCLFGLGWAEAVPVDTHVWQIAVRDYKFGKLKTKTFSKAMYDAVGDHFRDLWGKQAGWAHSVLFTADLRAFSDRLTEKKEPPETIIKAEDTLITPDPSPLKKRKAAVVKVVKTEEVETSNTVAVVSTRASKRLRTKS